MAGGEEAGPAPGSVVQTADGRRSVGLLLPYAVGGITVSVVTLQPCTFGHLLRFRAGKFHSSLDLLLELTGLTFQQVEGLRQPDDGRVMEAFLAHVHPEIAEHVNAGSMPLPENYAPSVASGAAPAAPAGPLAPGSVGPAEEAPGQDMPDWGGIEGMGERPDDYIPGIDD